MLLFIWLWLGQVSLVFNRYVVFACMGDRVSKERFGVMGDSCPFPVALVWSLGLFGVAFL